MDNSHEVMTVLFVKMSKRDPLVLRSVKLFTNLHRSIPLSLTLPMVTLFLSIKMFFCLLCNKFCKLSSKNTRECTGVCGSVKVPDSITGGFTTRKVNLLSSE